MEKNKIMRKHQTFEEFVKRFRELSGLKPDDDPIELLPKQIPAIEYLTEERMKKLNESSLNRIHQHLLKHDIATISAWRKENINCVNDKEKDKVFTREEKDERNKELYSALMKKRYGVTHIKGIIKEGKQIVQENSYLVVSLNDDVNFINNIIKLGKHYCQDSILIKEKDKDEAYLYGTNHFKIPGLDKKLILGVFHPGLENDIMSKIQGRPFYFGEDIDRDGPIQFERYDELGMGGKQGITITCKKIIEELNL